MVYLYKHTGVYRVYRSLQDFSGICKSLQKYTRVNRVYRNMQVFRNMQELTRVYRNMPRFYRNMQEFTEICKSLQEYARVCRKWYTVLFYSCLVHLTSQDLTRLKVQIAYLPHMFEDALKEKRGGTHSAKKHTLVEPTSSFDQEVERSDAMPRMNRRGSSGR